MNWTHETPKVEGWYFHRESERRLDPLHWETYFVELNADGTKDYWDNGSTVRPPRGGQWAGPLPLPDC